MSQSSLTLPRGCAKLTAFLCGVQLALVPVAEAATNIVQSVDVNGDGIRDFDLVERELTSSFPGGLQSTGVTWTLQPADHERARGNLILTNPVVLALGDSIPLDPAPPTRWQTNGVLLLSAQIGTGTGWWADGPLTNAAGAFLGVKLPAQDGAHLGWVQGLQTETRPGWRPMPRLVDFGYQPAPGAELKVGDKPAFPARDEVKTFVPVDLRGTGQFDFMLCVTRWTSRADGASGVSAVLTNVPGYEVLAAPGVIEGQSVWFAEPVPERALVPEAPKAPALWTVAVDGLVLLNEVRPAGGEPARSAGPLANEDRVIVALRGVNLPDLRAGWLMFDRDFQLLGQHAAPDYYPAAGVTHPPASWLDINGDGLVDFARREYFRREVVAHNAIVEWRGTVLDSLSGSAVLGSGSAPPAMTDCGGATALEPRQVIAADPPPAAGQWLTNAVGLQGTFRWDNDFNRGELTYAFNGFMGLRFMAEDGPHHAWWTGSRDAFEPCPRQTLAVGQTPMSLGALLRGGEVLISWNRSLDGFGVEFSPQLPALTWTRVPTASPGLAVVPLSGAQGFFRLRGPDQPRRVWSLEGHAGPITSLAMSADGSLLLSVGEDRAVRLWRSADGARLRGFPAEDRGGCEASWSGAVSPDGARVAVLCHSGPRLDLNPPEPFGTSAVRIYRSETGQPDGSFGLPNPGPGEVQFSPDGQYLYATSVGPGWWMQAGVLYDLARGTSDYPGTLLKAFAPDEVHYLDCEGNLVHAPSAQTVRPFGTHTNCAWPAAFSPDGTILAEGDGADVRLWQVNDGAFLRRLPGRASASVTATAFSPTGQHLFTSTPDNGLHVWQVADGAWRWSQTAVALAAFALDGARLWTLCTDGRVRSWRVSDGSLIGSTTEHFSHRTAAFSPDGAWLFTGSSTGTLGCWDVSDVTSP